MLQDQLREIRTQLRMAMNGVISTSMREKGVVYKLNFGVPLPEVKQISASGLPDMGRTVPTGKRYNPACKGRLFG